MTSIETPLWKHQENAVALSLKYQNMALFFEMGTGKSRTLINILRHKYAHNKRLMKTLIISPPITLQNWRNEFKIFSKISPLDVVVLKGSGKQRLKQLQDAVIDPTTHQMSRAKIVVTNYETMQMPAIVKALKEWGIEILVCDEAHRLRNHKSKRAKVVASLSDGAKHRYLLTGSPILNSVEDLFYQYRCLDGGATFGDNFYVFRARYMVDKNAAWSSRPNYFPKYEPRKELFPELNAKMYSPGKVFKEPKSLALRVLKSECLDLPPLTKQIYPVELSADQKKLYKEMRDEYLTYVESLKKEGTPIPVVANLAITKALRLQQITSGFVKAEDSNEYIIQDNPRLEALRDLLEEITASGHKVIVWAVFKFNYVQIAKVCKELGLEYREIHGDVPLAAKNQQMDDFRKDPKVKVMIANQASAGVGINLVEAAYSIFFSRNFSLEQDMQAEARNYRGGSEIHKSVTRIDLVAPDTTDELIAEALAGKQNLAEKILEWKI